MLLNADPACIALVHAGQLDWQPSPSPGVERRLLMRIGEERAIASTLVRFAPGSSFPPHHHPGGEEFLVLEGCFVDASGHYPAGSYVRNPPGSCHAPSAPQGCTILVHLCQFAADDQLRLSLLPDDSWPQPAEASQPGQRLLFASPHERVSIHSLPAGKRLQLDNPDGLQLLLLDGNAHWQQQNLQTHSWLRLPAGHPLDLQAGDSGCQLWLKQSAPLWTTAQTAS